MKRNDLNGENIVESKKESLRKNLGFFSFTMLMIVLFSVPVTASARKGRPIAEQERYVLDFGNSYYHGVQGDGATLYLKKALKRQYPGIDISNYRLDEIVLVAKTRFGKGNAQLRVGPGLTGVYRVAGRPQDFNSNRKHSFDRVRIDSPFHDSWGPWQLNLRGIFKVQKVVLLLEKRQNHHYGWAPNHSPNKPKPQYRDRFPHDGRFYFNMKW